MCGFLILAKCVYFISHLAEMKFCFSRNRRKAPDVRRNKNPQSFHCEIYDDSGFLSVKRRLSSNRKIFGINVYLNTRKNRNIRPGFYRQETSSARIFFMCNTVIGFFV